MNNLNWSYVVWVTDIWTQKRHPCSCKGWKEARRQLQGSLIWISRDFVSFLTLYLWLKLMAAEIFWSFRFHVCGKVPFLGQNWMSTNCSSAQSQQPSTYNFFPTATCSSIRISNHSACLDKQNWMYKACNDNHHGGDFSNIWLFMEKSELDQI